uniref:ArsR family transcriptional regulator n=1 Tax=Thermofilum pendens TaxID=2269 RepID=A0A7C4FFR4_THEPE
MMSYGLEVYRLQSRLCRFLSHPERLRITEVLGTGEKSVSELVELTGLPQPTVSRHLGLLAELGVLEAERRGRRVYYKLKYPEVLEASRILRSVLLKILEEKGRLTVLVSAEMD